MTSDFKAHIRRQKTSRTVTPELESSETTSRFAAPALGALLLVISCGDYSSGPAGMAGAGTGGSASSTGGTNTGATGGTSATGGTGATGGTVSSEGTGASGGTGSGATAGAGGSNNSGAAGMAVTSGGSGGTGGFAANAGSGSTPNGGMAGAGNAPTTGGSGGLGGMTAVAGRGNAGSAGMAGSAGAPPMSPDTVCGVLAAAGNTCAAAHSTTRVLYPAYTGPLYQVCKGSSAPGPKSCTSGNTKDISSIGGYADSATQDSFCAGGSCTISIIYDQSPNKNDLKPAPSGGAKGSPDNPANATDLKTTLAGHAVYGVLIKPGMGYRAGCTGCDQSKATGTAVDDEPETQYMVTSQKDLVDGCCFDYGNAETSAHDDGNGTMEAVYFGGGVVWGTGSPGGHDNGPWVMADLENGLYAGWENNQDQNISTNTPMKYDFVTAVLLGDVKTQNSGKGRFALYGADATNGTLKTLYDGIRPSKTGYVPMKKQGSIILGIGGDNSAGDGGRWYEGVMASGAASMATLNALQSNIVAAKYGK